jgi:hypothetical protein
MRGEREDKQREKEGREQHQELESVFVVGVCGGGKLRAEVLPSGATAALFVNCIFARLTLQDPSRPFKTLA